MTGYDRDVRSSDGRPARLTRLIGTAIAIVAFTMLIGAAPPAPRAAGPVLQPVDAPTPGNGGAGGIDAFGILLIAGLALAIVVAIGAGIILFRTRGVARAAPPPAEGWWTCGNCGASNMDGAARCHACATWRSTTPRSTAATPTSQLP
jgi:hypothetical protein